MYCRLIGLGAAGNKAAICAVENNIMSVKQTMLVNSTLKDIPAEYQNKEGAIVYQLFGAYGGCGKERQISYGLLEETLKRDVLNLDEFLNVGQPDEAELVIIVASTEGGTGSGSAPLIANYIRSVYGIAVHVFGIAGFEDDVRGMRNTVDFFKEMSAEFTVECIKNSKFLSDCNGNKIKAEKKANEEFCKKISVLMGLQIRDSDHNIDPTDLLKLSTEEGYMIIETCVFDDKIKNREQFRHAVIDTFDKSKALDVDTESISKLGVIMNVKPESTDYIDYRDVVVDRFGVPYETYEHIQSESTMPEFIAFICAGLKMPTDEVEATYKNYEAAANRVNRDNDSFFSTIREKQIDPDDDAFNLKSKKEKTVDKNDFFKKNSGSSSVQQGKFSHTKVRMVSKDVSEGMTGDY